MKLTYLKRFILPKHNKDVERELDILNLKTIYYIALVESIVQIISLCIWIITNINKPDFSQIYDSIINISWCIALCIAGFIIAGYFRRKNNYEKDHSKIYVFVCAFMILLIIWGMFASLRTFIHGEQIINFFIVELISVLLIRVRPLFVSIVVLCSYTVFFCVLNFGVKEGIINPYNFFTMAAISVVGVYIAYHTTAKYIEQKKHSKSS